MGRSPLLLGSRTKTGRRKLFRIAELQRNNQVDPRPLSMAGATRTVAGDIQKYQTSSCQQLAAEKQATPDAQKEAMKDRIGQQLQRDPAMPAALVNKVAAPVVDKMIACGFIP